MQEPCVRCPACGMTCAAGDTAEMSRCPECGTPATPEFVHLDVRVERINWDALRLLATWSDMFAADRFPAGHLGRVELDLILRDLRRLRPEGGLPLTISEEAGLAVPAETTAPRGVLLH